VRTSAECQQYPLRPTWRSESRRRAAKRHIGGSPQATTFWETEPKSHHEKYHHFFGLPLQAIN
jgi:hypothetical protein